MFPRGFGSDWVVVVVVVVVAVVVVVVSVVVGGVAPWKTRRRKKAGIRKLSHRSLQSRRRQVLVS